MNLTMVFEPPHVCNPKMDFYRGKHHLEVDKIHLLGIDYLTPLSAIEQSNA